LPVARSAGDVGDELGQYREGEIGIRQLAPGIQLGARHLRILLRQVEPAVRREAAQQDFGEGLGGRVAAGGDVFSYYLNSGRFVEYRTN
jgi:hypothetical protein